MKTILLRLFHREKAMPEPTFAVVVKHQFQKVWDENHNSYPPNTMFIEECKFCDSREDLVTCKGSSSFTGCGAYLCKAHREFYPNCLSCHKANESYNESQKQMERLNIKPMVTSTSAVIIDDTPVYLRETANGIETLTWSQYQDLLRGKDAL